MKAVRVVLKTRSLLGHSRLFFWKRTSSGQEIEQTRHFHFENDRKYRIVLTLMCPKA